MTTQIQIQQIINPPCKNVFLYRLQRCTGPGALGPAGRPVPYPATEAYSRGEGLAQIRCPGTAGGSALEMMQTCRRATSKDAQVKKMSLQNIFQF